MFKVIVKHISTVSTEATAHVDVPILTEVFSQELPDTFDVQRFARELNRPTRKKRSNNEARRATST